MEIQSRKWLERVIPVIEDAEGISLEGLEKNGTRDIEGKSEVCYSAILCREDILDEVFVFACQEERRVILFRNFVQDEDCDQYPEDIALIEREGIKVMVWNKTKKWVMFNQIVVAKQYLFDEQDRLIEDKTGLRDDKDGSDFVGDMGSYDIRVGTKYTM